MTNRAAGHVPVMVDEVLSMFAPRPGDHLLDATVGLGGHAAAYLEATAPDGLVVGLDADATALATARECLSEYGDRITLIHSNYARLKDAVTGGGIVESGGSSLQQSSPAKSPGVYNHCLFDLGIGSHQLASLDRGFSFKSTAPLTMRYGAQDGLPAAQLQPLNYLEQRLGYPPDAQDIVERLHADELAQVLTTYSDERFSNRIAGALKRRTPRTADALAETVVAAVPRGYERGRIHPATRTFQALRLAVNRELETLSAGLPQAFELVAKGGVLIVISFHSLEDRIVKQFFRERGKRGVGTVLTKRPDTATEAEIAKNPRSRSAKLRGIRKKE